MRFSQPLIRQTATHYTSWPGSEYITIIFFSKFSQGADHCDSPSPVPSIISSTASPHSSSALSSTSSTIESDLSSTEDEDEEGGESPEPLAALEVLTEMNADEEQDLVEQFRCTQALVEVNREEDNGDFEAVSEVDNEVVSEAVRERRETTERVSSVRETLERTESSEESEEETKVMTDPDCDHLVIFIILVKLMFGQGGNNLEEALAETNQQQQEEQFKEEDGQVSKDGNLCSIMFTIVITMT